MPKVSMHIWTAAGSLVCQFVSDGNELLVSSPERAMLECLNLPESCWELHTNTQIRYGFLSASTGHGTSHKETYSDSPYRAETLRNQSWQPHCPARTSSPAAHSVLRLQSSHWFLKPSFPPSICGKFWNPNIYKINDFIALTIIVMLSIF